jgi:serpin B
MRCRIVPTCLAALLALSALLPALASDSRIASVARANNEFALDLYGKLADQAPGDNLFFSPASLSTALAMTYLGARGQTAEEMRRTLRFAQDGDELHAAMAELLGVLADDRAGHRLSIANALWGQRGWSFRDRFVARAERFYGAGLRRVDFAGATEEARLTINRWVEAQTNDRIEDLLAPGVLTPVTRLVLTNAVYFKGTWKTRFDAKRTRPEPFSLATGDEIEVAMMRHPGGRFGYHGADGVQVLELPYAGEDVSLVVFLPDRDSDLASLERRLTAERIDGWISRLRPQRMGVVAVPRFEMTGEFALAETLAALGMRAAFGTDADLSGMSDEDGLRLESVIHKAFVEVNEEGTEAAAATGVAARVKSAPPAEFRADRPFFFVIRDRRSGALLFVGRLTRPG